MMTLFTAFALEIFSWFALIYFVICVSAVLVSAFIFCFGHHFRRTDGETR